LVAGQPEAAPGFGGEAPQVVKRHVEAPVVGKPLVIGSEDRILGPVGERLVAEMGPAGTQREDFRLQPEADPQHTVATAGRFRLQSLIAGAQVDRRPVAGERHVEEEDQVGVGERPAGHHQVLVLAHAHERPVVERTAAQPDGLLAGVADQHQVAGSIDPE